MNENQVSASTETTDAENWDDITLDDLTDDAGEESGESAAAAEPEADQQTESQAAEGKPEAETGAEQEKGAADQPFVLKHLDETRTVGREEVIALAQKGMDYDRVRGKLDAAKEAIEWHAANAESVRWMEEIAREQNMTFGQLVDSTRAQIMASRTGQPLSVCQGIVANERKAAELEAQKKALESKTSQQDEQAASRARMEADVKAFAAAYPELVKTPEALPKEVWDAVHKGETLVNAYRAYENKQLRAQIEQQKTDAERRAQEEKNKARSTGSQKSTGQPSGDELFDSLWNNGD